LVGAITLNYPILNGPMTDKTCERVVGSGRSGRDLSATLQSFLKSKSKGFVALLLLSPSASKLKVPMRGHCA
jgi:hypothetical protein